MNVGALWCEPGQRRRQRALSAGCVLTPGADIPAYWPMAAVCRFCCKSPFALVIKISFGCTRDFRVKMWGTSSPDDKLTDDLRNVIEGTRISGRRWSFLTAEK